MSSEIEITLKKGVIVLAKVISNGNEPIEVLLKKFKRECEREAIIREWKRKEFYEKPSEIRKQRKKAVERKRLKKLRKLMRYTKKKI